MAKWRVHKTVRGTQSRAREEDQVVFKSFMYVLEKQSYMRGKEREREYLLPAGLFPKWLGQAEARSPELHLSLPHIGA